MDDKSVVNPDDSSLEGPASPEASAGNAQETASRADSSKPRKSLKLALIIGGAVLLLIIIGLLASLALKPKPAAKKAPQTVVINTQSLDNGTLNKIVSQNSNGQPVSQQLTISPSTLFKSNVAVQGSAEVDGQLDVKGPTNLQGAVTTNGNLAVHGNLSVTGQITAASLNVGSISLSTINLSGDLGIEGHIVPNGSAPSIRTSVATNGGSATISGNDTAGTVTINSGTGGLFIAGELVIITFHKAFNLTPKVELTPDNAAAANLRYFVTQSPTFFTIQSATAAAANTQYIFNYFVTQ